MHTCFPSNKKIIKEITKNMKAMYLKVGKAERRRRETSRGTKEVEKTDTKVAPAQEEWQQYPIKDDRELEVEGREAKEKEWVAEPEPGVLMTLVSRPDGRNHLKKIRFREELFDAWAAQSWWGENYDRIVALYSIEQTLVPITPYQSEEEVDMDQDHESGTTSNCSGPSGGSGNSLGSPILGLVMATEGAAQESSAEWVEEDEPGVFITVRSCPDGQKELRRVELSRERFGEVKARVWWEENKTRLQNLYSC